MFHAHNEHELTKYQVDYRDQKIQSKPIKIKTVNFVLENYLYNLCTCAIKQFPCKFCEILESQWKNEKHLKDAVNSQVS